VARVVQFCVVHPETPTLHATFPPNYQSKKNLNESDETYWMQGQFYTFEICSHLFCHLIGVCRSVFFYIISVSILKLLPRSKFSFLYQLRVSEFSIALFFKFIYSLYITYCSPSE
jgi:hypothetical protein